MEKIKQALERARSQREGGIKESTSDAVSLSSDIEYTTTQQVKGHVDIQRENRLLTAMHSGDYKEAFKILSTQVIQRMDENHWTSLAVTSVAEDEGKTTTAINLGISIAKEIEYTVLLVDTNLRSPEMHKYFGFEAHLGLSDYLQSDIELSEILIKPQEIDHLVILPGGAPVMNSTELLGSPKMNALVNEVKSRYPKRIVVCDLPPILNTADTLTLAPYIDCSLIVVEDDVTKESELKQAIDLLSSTNILGTVLNKVKN